MYDYSIFWEDIIINLILLVGMIVVIFVACRKWKIWCRVLLSLAVSVVLLGDSIYLYSIIRDPEIHEFNGQFIKDKLYNGKSEYSFKVGNKPKYVYTGIYFERNNNMELIEGETYRVAYKVAYDADNYMVAIRPLT